MPAEAVVCFRPSDCVEAETVNATSSHFCPLTSPNQMNHEDYSVHSSNVCLLLGVCTVHISNSKYIHVVR